MKSKINLSLFEGIFESGEIYMLLPESNRKSKIDVIEYLYSIRTIEEIGPAIDMELAVMSDTYRLEQLLSVTRLDNYSYSLDFWCYDKEEDCFTHYWLFLHRIPACEEMVCFHKEHFDFELGTNDYSHQPIKTSIHLNPGCKEKFIPR